MKFPKLGFTDSLALYCLAVIGAGLLLSYRLAVYSIEADYMGALACWTVAFTPVSTALGITLTAVVGKNKAENTTGGINHLKASGTTEGGI